LNESLRTQIVREPEIPFPQADSFRRIINLCELLNKSYLTKNEITANYYFDPRQSNYYTDAGRYLGLIGAFNDTFKLYYIELGHMPSKNDIVDM